MINNGTCIIYFEDFSFDNENTMIDIVWSGDKKGCHHIYHKECMVHYLAMNNDNVTSHYNNKQKGSLNGHSILCPTCHHSNRCGIVSGKYILQLFNNATTAVDTSSG